MRSLYSGFTVAWSRCIVAALVLTVSAGVCVTGHVGEASAEGAVCGGKNLLTELKMRDPATYERVMVQAGETKNGSAILWKVEKDGTPASYLFGTAHVHDPRLLDLPDALTSAIASASAVALELEDFSDAAMAAEMAKLGHLLVFSDGRSLKDYLTPEELTVVAKTLAPVGATPEMAALFQPWFVALAMAISPCQTRVLASGKPGVDEAIADLAKASGVKIVGLETAGEQMESAASASIDRQIAGLKTSIEMYGHADDMIETLIQLYLKRQITALIPFSIAFAKDKDAAHIALADMQRNLIDLRNTRMRDRSLALLEKGGAVVAVGALHLPGETGLVELYRKSGFRVTAVD